MTDLTGASRMQYRVGWLCPHCKQRRGKDYIDPCLGKLPGVRSACCGHGGRGNGHDSYDGYVEFENGTVIRFDRLTEVIPYDR